MGEGRSSDPKRVSINSRKIKAAIRTHIPTNRPLINSASVCFLSCILSFVLLA